MSGGFDSGGKGGSDGKATKKGSGFLDGLKSFGASMLEGFLGGVAGQPATGQSGRPAVNRRDPVAERDRPLAAKQIHRSLKAWRDKEAEAPGDSSARKDAAAEAQDTTNSTDSASQEVEDRTAAESPVDAADAPAPGDNAAEEKGPETDEAAPTEAPKSVAAKLRGIHRKVFRAPIVVPPSGGGGRRPNDGLNVKPILGKLDQAHAMFVNWAQRGTVPEAQAMLAALGAAKDKAHELDERVESGRVMGIDALKTDLSQRLQAIQRLDPGYELFSIGAMAITINFANRRMPTVTPPPWKCDRPAALAAYRAALQRQQDGINAMTSDQWDKNKDQYTNQGRSDVGSAMQQEFGRRSRAPGARSPGDAPHNPDQISAGYPDPTGLPDPVYVNRSIGSYWAKDNRAQMISDAVKAIHPLTRLVTQMSVSLTVS